MQHTIDMEKGRSEELRWLILLALDAAGYIGTSEVVIRNAVEPVFLDITQEEVRNELYYLEDRKLITVTDKDGPVWHAKIGRYGTDIVKYTIPCDPGIKRPRQC